jgi:hypothetical protein
VDDAKLTADGATVSDTSFEDDLGGWTVPGAPADSGANANDWPPPGDPSSLRARRRGGASCS